MYGRFPSDHYMNSFGMAAQEKADRCSLPMKL